MADAGMDTTDFANLSPDQIAASPLDDATKQSLLARVNDSRGQLAQVGGGQPSDFFPASAGMPMNMNQQLADAASTMGQMTPEKEAMHASYMANAPAARQEAARKSAEEAAAVTDRDLAAAPKTAQQSAPGAVPFVPIGVPGAAGLVAAEGEQGRAAIDAENAHQIKQAEAQKKLAEIEKQTQATAAENRLRAAERELDRRAAEQKYQKLANDVAEGRTDPDHFYKNEDGSTNYGRKIGAAIAMAMGAFGAALTKGPNYAMEIINGAIDRDIAAQRDKQSTKKELMQQSKMDAREIEAHNDKLADQDESYRIQALAHAKNEIADFMSSTSDTEHKARLEGLLAQVHVVQQQTIQQGAERQADWKLKNRTLAMEEARAGRGGQKPLEAGTVDKVTDLQTAKKAVDNLGKEFTEKTGWASGLNRHIPGTDATAYEDSRHATAVSIAKMLGDTSREGAIDEYMSMLPEAGDSEGRAANKFKVIKNLIDTKLGGTKRGLAASGYDTSAIGTGVAERPPK